MLTGNPEYDREILSFDEKIALAELEVSKAEERVKELSYQKSRYQLEYLLAWMRAQSQAQPQQNAQPAENK
jgi:capsule polysaccharide export protein KpsE/RkpR